MKKKLFGTFFRIWRTYAGMLETCGGGGDGNNPLSGSAALAGFSFFFLRLRTCRAQPGACGTFRRYMPRPGIYRRFSRAGNVKMILNTGTC